MDNNKWVKFWNDRAEHVEKNVKYANGRGSYSDDSFNSIYKDIIKILNIDSTSSVLDVGGKTAPPRDGVWDVRATFLQVVVTMFLQVSGNI